MTNVALVSGAWQARWSRQRLIPLLEAQHYRIVAPNLLGRGEDPTPASTVPLAD